MVMDSSRRGRWVISFKKFSRLMVKSLRPWKSLKKSYLCEIYTMQKWVILRYAIVLFCEIFYKYISRHKMILCITRGTIFNAKMQSFNIFLPKKSRAKILLPWYKKDVEMQFLQCSYMSLNHAACNTIFSSIHFSPFPCFFELFCQL